MKKLLQYTTAIALVFFFLAPLIVSAQEHPDVEMADAFRAEGKIYIVIAGMALILAGVFIYLFRIDKKVGTLEKKLLEKK